MSNIDRLFTERIEYYGNVELNRVNIKTNIINILLKVKYNSTQSS